MRNYQVIKYLIYFKYISATSGDLFLPKRRLINLNTLELEECDTTFYAGVKYMNNSVVMTICGVQVALQFKVQVIFIYYIHILLRNK